MRTSLWRSVSGRLTSDSWGRVTILVADDGLPGCQVVDPNVEALPAVAS